MGINNETAFIDYELTRSQLLIWTGQKISPTSPMYNMAFSYELNNAIDVQKFKLAFQYLVDTCDALRTTIIEVNEQPKQRIANQLKYELKRLDFSDRLDEIDDWISTRSQQQFKLDDCLFDATLVKVTDNKFIFFLNQHHLITDAWSITVQYQALTNYYQQLVKGDNLSNALIAPYSAFIKYEAAQRSCSVNEAAVNHWNSQEVYPVTFYRNENPALKSHSKRIHLSLGKEKTSLLKELTQEQDLRTWTSDLSLFSIFASVLLAYMYRITNQQQLSFGTPSHNRTTDSFKKSAGLFIELFPITVAIKKGSTS